MAFNTQGATPNINTNYGAGYTNPFSAMGGSTPQSKALSSAATGNPSVPTNTATPYHASIAPVPTNTSTPYNASIAPTTTGLIPSSQKITNVDGSTHEVKYQTPEAGAAGPAGSNLTVDPAKTQPLTAAQLTAKNGGVANLPQTTPTTPTSDSTASQTPTYPGLVGQSATAAAGNISIGQSAADIQANYGKQIADVGNLGAGMVAGDMSTGTQSIGEGNAAIASNAASSRINALGTAEQGALAGTGQQLTAQNQAQTGLLGAAGAFKPEATAQGQTTYDPATNTFSGGSYQNNLSTVVNAIKSANMGYTDGVNSLASLSPTAKADVLAALGPGFDTVASDANASIRNQNIFTGGTAAVDAAKNAYMNAYPQVRQLNQAVNNITSLGNMTVQNAQGNDINPFAAAPANATLAQIKTGLSNAGQVTFNSNMAQLQQAIQSLYATSGGNTPTGVQTAIGQMADGSLQVQGLQALLSAAQSEGTLLLGNAKATAASEYEGTQGGSPTATPGSTGTGAFDDSSFYGTGS